MENETDEPVSVELTKTVLQVLMNTTGGDVDLHTPKKRALVRSLHDGHYGSNHRWVVLWDREVMETAYVHLTTYFLNHPKYRTRIMNVLCKQSPVFQELVARDEAKARKAPS